MYPRNPHYRTKEQRLQTFANFPTHFKATHEEFADAGTFFLSSFFIFPPIFHISTLFSYIALDHDESTYVELFTTSRSLISNYFMLDWFFRISNLTLLRLFTVRVFPSLHTFFHISANFSKFPPIFTNFRSFLFHVLLGITSVTFEIYLELSVQRHSL